MDVVAVIDFETTGLSPNEGARATEVAAVILKDGEVVDRYQSLMNAGVRISSFIESLTGITNTMIRSAPPAAAVMREVASFVGDIPLVAHNAAFDSHFWDAELDRIDQRRAQPFACSLLLSRRILPLAVRAGVKLASIGRYKSGAVPWCHCVKDFSFNSGIYRPGAEVDGANWPMASEMFHGMLKKTEEAPYKKRQRSF